MSKIASERIVGEHTIDGHDIQVQLITWAGTDRVSYDLVEASTGAMITTEESFDSYPTRAQMEGALAAAGSC